MFMATSPVKLVSSFVCSTEEKLGREKIYLKWRTSHIGHLTRSREYAAAVPA